MARVLFLHWPILGIASQVGYLKNYAAHAPQIDPVHIEIDRPFWVKVLGKSLPLHGWDLHALAIFLAQSPAHRKLAADFVRQEKST